MILFNCKGKNAKLIWALAIAGVLILISILFVIAAGSRKGAIINDVDALLFSETSGFYEEPFDLKIKSVFGDVYYTLDGSVPDKNSNKYTEKIRIDDASVNDNIYSAIKDVTPGLCEEYLNKYGMTSNDFAVPNYRVDKATVVRAVVYYGNDSYSDVETEVYFVGFDKKEGYQNTNILSVVCNPEDLFGYEKGIYVLGKTFDDYEKNELANAEKPISWRWWEGNYRNHGVEWERSADCQFFDENKDLLLSQKLGIRIHGAMSRFESQKSFTLRSRDKYDGNNRLLYDLFEDGKHYSAVTLSNGGNDAKVKLKDYLIETVAQELNIATQKYVPYTVFINGEYWGMYWLCNKYDDPSFYFNNYGIDEDNLIVLKDNYMEEGVETDYPIYGQMQGFCLNNDLSDPANYAQACEYLDISSYIDYYAMMIYIARCKDWPQVNMGYYRARKVQNSANGDGRWRLILFDLNGDDAGFVEQLSENDLFIKAMEDDMFKNFMRNPEFRNALYNRIMDMKNIYFTEERIAEIIEEYKILYGNAIVCSGERFYGQNVEDDINMEIESIMKFFAARGNYVENTIEDAINNIDRYDNE